VVVGHIAAYKKRRPSAKGCCVGSFDTAFFVPQKIIKELGIFKNMLGGKTIIIASK